MIDIDIITAENLIEEIQKVVDRAKRTEDDLFDLIGAGIYDRHRDVAFDGVIEMDRHIMHGYDAMRALMTVISAAKARDLTSAGAGEPISSPAVTGASLTKFSRAGAARSAKIKNWLPHRPYGEKGDLTMQITVFAKKRTTEDGKFFYTYLTTLVNKWGEAKTASVKFRDTAGNPKPEQCPMNIKFDKADANLSSRKYVKTSGEEGESLTLWITSWVPGDVYEDHSLDDYDF